MRVGSPRLSGRCVADGKGQFLFHTIHYSDDPSMNNLTSQIYWYPNSRDKYAFLVLKKPVDLAPFHKFNSEWIFNPTDNWSDWEENNSILASTVHSLDVLL